jgi:hypothetical protein
MFRYTQIFNILIFAFACLLIWGCATLKPTPIASLATNELIETLRHERIEQLYYKNYPPNVKEMMVRNNIVLDLVSAYDRGGDDLYRFNLIVILNHRSALSDSERATIIQCLERAVKDSFSWSRTEAVWGLGLLSTPKSISSIIPLLDDPDANVVNETILTLAKLAGIKDLPIANKNVSDEERQEAVKFWKEMVDIVNPEKP